MKFEELSFLVNWPLEEAAQSQVYWLILLAFITSILFLWLIRKLKKDLVPVFSDQEGKVQMTHHALQELVRRTCEQMDGIHHPKTKIIRKRNSLRLNVRIDFQTNSDVMAIRTELTRKLEEVMNEKLNFQNFEGVDLVIKGFEKIN